MTYACIQDCSICPFYHRDVSARVYHNIERQTEASVLPNGLIKTSVKQTAETIKSEEKEEEEKIEQTETSVNLPATQELQYEVETVPEKKKLFGWRKK